MYKYNYIYFKKKNFFKNNNYLNFFNLNRKTK